MIPIALYSEKIADNDRKIEQLSKNIKRDTEKRKKLMEENARESVYAAMCERSQQIEIAHKQKEAPDMEVESIKGDILKLDTEIRSLMDRMAEADDEVFAYIQQRIKELHSRKSELERKLQTKSRKRKAINTKPLTGPLAMWDTLTVQEKHDVAAEMIEVVYISHLSEDIEIRFGI